MEKLTIDAETEKMIEILCVGDYVEDSRLADMTDEELIQEGIKLGYWKRCTPNKPTKSKGYIKAKKGLEKLKEFAP